MFISLGSLHLLIQRLLLLLLLVTIFSLLFLALDPKVKIFIADFFPIIFEAESKKKNDQILKSINQEAEIIFLVNQIKANGVTVEQLKIFGQKFPLVLPYIDSKQTLKPK